MRSYLLYSSSLHGGLALFLALFSLTRAPKPNYYSIDFLASAPAPLAPPAQPGPRISAQAAAAPAPDKPLPAPQASPSGLKAAKAVTSNEAEIPLPKKTRFFRELKAKEDFNPVMSASQKIPAPPPASAPASPSSARAAVASSDSGMSLEAVAANLPNFPFPWYLARVRSNLFTQWAQKNQDLPLECLISFVIRRDGSISLVKVKRSSGNRYFDYDAVSSVEQSAPFPPLPEALPDPDLRVHVNFKALSRSSS